MEKTRETSCIFALVSVVILFRKLYCTKFSSSSTKATASCNEGALLARIVIAIAK